MNTLFKMILAFSLLATALFAVEYSGKGHVDSFVLSDFNAEESVNGSLKYKWKLWTLMGEPVDMLMAQWRIQGVDFSPGYNPKEDEKLKSPRTGSLSYSVCYGKEDYDCVPKHIMQKARIVELKMIGHGGGKFRTRSKKYSYIFDAGVMAKPGIDPNAYTSTYGKWSYNTPGSKNWDNCFEHETAERSKQIMKSKIGLNYFSIDTIKFDLSDIKRYIIKRNKEYHKRELMKKAKQEKSKQEKASSRKSQQQTNNDPFAALEAVHSDEIIKKNIENIENKIQNTNNIINERYASVDSSLRSEARIKESIFQATKDRVDNRSVSSGNRIPKSYVVKKTIIISKNDFRTYTGVKYISAYPFGVFFTGNDTHKDSRLWLKKNEKMLTVKDFFNVDQNYMDFKIVELDKNEFLVYLTNHRADYPVIYRVDELGNKIGSYNMSSVSGFKRINSNAEVWEGNRGEIIVQTWRNNHIRDHAEQYTVFSKDGKLIDQFIYDKLTPDYSGKYSRMMIKKSKKKPVPEIKFDYQKGIRFIGKSKEKMVGLNYLDNDNERSFDRKTKEIIITNYTRENGKRSYPIDLYNKVKIRVLKPKY